VQAAGRKVQEKSPALAQAAGHKVQEKKSPTLHYCKRHYKPQNKNRTAKKLYTARPQTAVQAARKKALHRRRTGVKSYQKKLDKAEIDVIVKT